MRSGMRKRASTAVVTAVSVGEMIAPNVNAAAHGISGNKILAAQPIANAVKNTRPTASSSIGRRLARKARHTVKNALACTSGGRNSAMYRSGSRSSVRIPGVSARSMPPSTNATAGGVCRRRATSASMTATVSSSRTSSNAPTGVTA